MKIILTGLKSAFLSEKFLKELSINKDLDRNFSLDNSGNGFSIFHMLQSQ